MAISKRWIRSGATLAAVLLLVGAIAVGNNTAQRLATQQQAATFLKDMTAKEAERREVLSWEQLSQTRANIFGVRYPEVVGEAEGNRTTVLGYPLPVHPSLLTEAQQESGNAYYLLMAMPRSLYVASAPPMNEVLLVELKEGEVIDAGPEAVVGIHGRLRLHGDDASSTFLFALMEAETVQIRGLL